MEDDYEDVPMELRDEVIENETSEVVKERLKNMSVEELQERVKEDAPSLKLKVSKPNKIHRFKKNDYITFRCNVCEIEVTHNRKDDDGSFEPWQLCQHVVFKGLVAED